MLTRGVPAWFAVDCGVCREAQKFTARALVWGQTINFCFCFFLLRLLKGNLSWKTVLVSKLTWYLTLTILEVLSQYFISWFECGAFVFDFQNSRSPPCCLSQRFVGVYDVSVLSDSVSIWLPQRNLLLLRTILSQNTKKAKTAVTRKKASIQMAAMKEFLVV